MEREKFLEGDKEISDLFAQINNLKQKLQDLYTSKYNRALPFNELLFDRWEKAAALGFGAGTSVYDSAVVLGDVTVGKNTWIGPHVILDGSGKLFIGDHCSISANVQLYSHDSVNWATSGGKDPYEYSETRIGNNCYLGPNTIVGKGVVLGDGCIVGANSFVNQSYPAHSKIAGNPAKII